MEYVERVELGTSSVGGFSEKWWAETKKMVERGYAIFRENHPGVKELEFDGKRDVRIMVKMAKLRRLRRQEEGYAEVD